jgi:hypothetical protein
MNHFQKMLVAGTVALVAIGGTANAEMSKGAEPAIEAHVYVLSQLPKGDTMRSVFTNLQVSREKMDTAQASVAQNPALKNELLSKNVELNNIVAVHAWGNDTFDVYVR